MAFVENGQTVMKELHSEIEIQASAQRVWKLLTDFTSFPLWNPFIRRVSGEVKEGKQIKVYVQPSGTSGIKFQPTILKVEPNRELRWRGHFLTPGFFDGEHIFTIEPLDENCVRFVQREIFNGSLVPLFANKLDNETMRGFEEMNHALKVQAEQKKP